MKKKVNFLKMEGLSNDFIIAHGLAAAAVSRVAKRAPALCDRRRSVGADGVILMLPPSSKTADFRMRIFNADGSEAEMCGNGIRCCALYAKTLGLSRKKKLLFETKAGPISTEFRGRDMIRVNMGPPVLESSAIPTAKPTCRVIMHDLQVDCRPFKITAVSMGNPHAVIYCDDLTDDLVTVWGRRIETHPFFPKKTNVEFVKVLSGSEIAMRVWERGCGETCACGTGACASVVAGIINNLHGARVTVHLKGGDLLVEWDGDENSPVFMTGPARIAFRGSVDLDV
jgi:diaminopimelate epimerase